jgi:hypothetical protein
MRGTFGNKSSRVNHLNRRAEFFTPYSMGRRECITFLGESGY